MKLSNFSFKREPVWILLFSLAPAALGLLIVLIVLVIRRAELAAPGLIYIWDWLT